MSKRQGDLSQPRMSQEQVCNMRTEKAKCNTKPPLTRVDHEEQPRVEKSLKARILWSS